MIIEWMIEGHSRDVHLYISAITDVAVQHYPKIEDK